ncbi:hypothetical protein ACH5RR_000965 [Cinchona calisaya]|uniref:Zinc finger GRF-type domain-containing protein n=1 Tax=Cinchona calisaya TaxID=153742 RepID=A0ABD3B274_9GENT
MASRSGSENSSGTSKLRCNCCAIAPINMSLTKWNLGRRFTGCRNYQWVDGSTCARGLDFANVVADRMVEQKDINSNLADEIQHLNHVKEELIVKVELLKKRKQMLKKQLEEARVKNKKLEEKLSHVEEIMRKFICLGIVIISVLVIICLKKENIANKQFRLPLVL